MNIIWMIGLFYLSAEVTSTYGQLRMDVKKKWCGSRLADVMELICKGSYYEKNENSKKDLRFEDFNSYDDYVNDQPEQISWPFLPQNTATALIGSQGRIRIHRRSKPGIIEECCHNPCSPRELSSYCSRPSI